MREQPIVGTITNALRGALDGTLANCISRTEFGYIVELLASKGAFIKGDKVYVDDGDFCHFGASIKDAGHRGSMFSFIEASESIDALRKTFLQEWSSGICDLPGAIGGKCTVRCLANSAQVCMLREKGSLEPWPRSEVRTALYAEKRTEEVGATSLDG